MPSRKGHRQTALLVRSQGKSMGMDEVLVEVFKSVLKRVASVLGSELRRECGMER